MSYDKNPFHPTDQKDPFQIWEALVRRDIDAFLDNDWGKTAPDFKEGGFFGIKGEGDGRDLDAWVPLFPNLAAYKEEWLAQAAETQAKADLSKAREALFRATDMTDIQVNGDFALVHKKFDGHMPLSAGGSDRLNWRTVYFCERVSGKWLIASFIGYLKNKDA